jgi:hypothetical protein
MILKIKHFDEAVFRGKMEHLKDVPFTLFVDDIPQVQEDLSEVNVLVEATRTKRILQGFK